MQVHTIEARQRRMLLEMLASERAGEEALFVGRYLGRDGTAGELCGLSMSAWVDEQRVVFTVYGRHIAEAFASRLVGRERGADRVC